MKKFTPKNLYIPDDLGASKIISFERKCFLSNSVVKIIEDCQNDAVEDSVPLSLVKIVVAPWGKKSFKYKNFYADYMYVCF